MGSDGNQGITASTHQAAMSSRNRRASAVSEVTEAGRVEQSTRVVANFNHMHALSIQYYEVVQTFRVTTSVSQVFRAAPEMSTSFPAPFFLHSVGAHAAVYANLSSKPAHLYHVSRSVRCSLHAGVSGGLPAIPAERE